MPERSRNDNKKIIKGGNEIYLSKMQTKCMALITTFVMILSCLVFIPAETKAAGSTTPAVSVLGASGHQSMRIGVMIENVSKAGACGMSLNIGGKTVRIATDGDGTDVIKGDKIYAYNKETDSILYTAVITNIPKEHFSTDISVTGTLTTLKEEEKSSKTETKTVTGVVEKMKDSLPNLELLEDGTLVNETAASLDTSKADSVKDHGTQNDFYVFGRNWTSAAAWEQELFDKTKKDASAEYDSTEQALKFTTDTGVGKALAYQFGGAFEDGEKVPHVFQFQVKADSSVKLKLCDFFGSSPINNQVFSCNGDWQTITVKTDIANYGAIVLTTETAGAVYYVKSCKVRKPLTSDNFSGTISLPGKPLDLSGTVMLGGGSPNYNSEDGSVSATNCDGLVIPLDKDYDAGDELKITVFGEASQEMRAWLEPGINDAGKVSNIHSPVNSGEEFTLTATANGAKYLEIKKPYGSSAYTNIKITRVELTDLTQRPVLDTEGWVTT